MGHVTTNRKATLSRSTRGPALFGYCCTPEIACQNRRHRNADRYKKRAKTIGTCA